VGVAVFGVSIFFAIEMQSERTSIDELYIVLTVLGALTALSYIILVAGKKLGFYMACTCALAMACACAAALVVFKALIGIAAVLVIIGPVITWLLIRKNWSNWQAIGKFNQQLKNSRVYAVASQSAQQPAEQSGLLQQMQRQQQQAAPASYHYTMVYSPFAKRARAVKIWSIVNTCLFFILVAPIVVIVFAGKAKNAANEQEYRKRIKVAVILNIGTYTIVSLIGIINGILTRID
jgi:hypothetical protein